MNVSVEIEFDEPNAAYLEKVISPDNGNLISMDASGNHVIIRISELKLSSLYNIIDDLIRDIEVGKKVESDL